jgi:hypothetical protein
MATGEGRRGRNRSGNDDADDAQDRNGNGAGEDESLELRGSPEMDVAVISGMTFTQKAVTYYDVDGIAMFEGDIALGTVEEVRNQTQAVRDALATGAPVAFGVGITGSQFRWPNCRMPYEIDPALPNQQRVTDAIAHWEANTAFRFPQRTAANASQYPNWVRFTNAGGCWSMLGMRGGQQTISLDVGCSTGNTIHEIGHAAGLWHEQSREDRDLFVTINWANIQDGMAAQFNQRITDGDDLGTYDYGSIMHYPRTAFSKNGRETITPTNASAVIGQRTGLSPGDIAAIQALYPGCSIKQPWAEPIKKLRDDPRFKKIADDEIVVKPLRDPVKPLRDPVKPIRDPVKPIRDPGPIKHSLDPIGPLRPELQPNLRPFSMATSHHAALGGAGAEEMAQAETAGYLASLQRQLLDIEAAIDLARSTASQAHADIARLEEARDSILAVYTQALADSGMG